MTAALSQILRLVDIACDIRRNASDSQFSKNLENELIPVVDENVFEMFIEPWRHYDAAETFYSELWSHVPLDPSTRGNWRSFEEQAAAIAAEYLLCGKLPGSADDLIYMTEFHRFELSTRLIEHIEELKKVLKDNPSAYNKDLRLRFDVSSYLFSAPENQPFRRIPEIEDCELASDLQKINHVDEIGRNRFRAARMITKLLTDSRVLEPSEQAKRLLGAPIKYRLRTLEGRFTPTEEEFEQIDADAQKWFERIADELKRPGHRERQRAKNIDYSQRPLWNDARSLAYLLWVSRRKLNNKQRLIFITGDAVMFDAYRRWYFGIPDKEVATEPFLLRRVTQYAPLFNPNDMQGDFARSVVDGEGYGNIFPLIEQAVEASLLIVQGEKREETPATVESITSKKREELALKLIDSESLSSDADSDLARLRRQLSGEWKTENETWIPRNRALWQQLERLSIGTSYDLVAPRINESQRAMANQYLAASDSDDARILSDYASQVLNELRENSISHWLQVAESFNLGRLQNFGWRRPQIRRLSLAFHVPTASDHTPNEQPAESRAVLVFTQATLKAIELQDISNAHRFADMAAQAHELAAEELAADIQVGLELKYLNAVTNRLLITISDAHFRVDGRSSEEGRLSASRSLKEVKEAFDRASVLIDECLAIHHQARDNPYHFERYIRALSERASLHLFIATSFGLARPEYHDLIQYNINGYLDIAQGDLRRCMYFDRNWEAETEILAAVRNQYIPNIAGYETISYLLDSSTYKQTDWSNKSLRRLHVYWETATDIHPLLSVELTAFYWLTKKTVPAGRRINKSQSWASGDNLRMPMDKVLFRAIHRGILNDYRA